MWKRFSPSWLFSGGSNSKRSSSTGPTTTSRPSRSASAGPTASSRPARSPLPSRATAEQRQIRSAIARARRTEPVFDDALVAASARATAAQDALKEEEDELQLALALSLSANQADESQSSATATRGVGAGGQRPPPAPGEDTSSLGGGNGAGGGGNGGSTEALARESRAPAFDRDVDPTAAAQAAAQEKFAEIVANCEMTCEPFVDPGFIPGPQILYANGHCRRRQASSLEVVRHFGNGGSDGIEWLSAGQILQRPDDLLMDFSSTQEMMATAHQFSRVVEWRVFQEDPAPTDISQGGLGNCWFCGSLAAVAEKPFLVRRLFVDPFSHKGDVSPRGVYLIQLCDGGEWSFQILDGLLPCTRQQMLAFSGARRNQLWVPLLEKAYAKLRSNYEAVEGGTPAEGLRLLTGWPSIVQELRTDSEELEDQQVSAQAMRTQAVCPFAGEDLLWIRLVSAFETGLIICGSCGHVEGITDEQYRSSGLSPSHCYSIVRVVSAMQGSLRLLQLRNPWGTGRKWNGKFSDQDEEHWTPELRVEVQVGDLGEVGIFWMELQDLRRYFTSITICPYRDGWAEARRVAEFPASASQGSQPAFLLSSGAAVEVLLSIMQPEERSSPTMMTADVGLAIFRIPRGTRLPQQDGKLMSLDGIVACDAAARRVQDTLACDYMMTASPGSEPEPVLVVPLCFNQRVPPSGGGGNDKRFTFACFSAHPVVIRSLAISAEAHRAALVEHVKWLVKHGKRGGSRAQLIEGAFLYKATDGGLTVVVENGSLETLMLESQLTDVFNLTVSRGLQATSDGETYMFARDTVPPMHGMVVFVAATMPAGHRYHFAPKVSLVRHGEEDVHEPPLAEPDALHTPFLLPRARQSW